jgi:hypothetical protein
MKFLERIPDPLVLVGALIGLTVVCVAWEISTEYRRVVHRLLAMQQGPGYRDAG